MRRPDARGKILQRAGRRGQDTLPDAWRRAGIGRAPGKSECRQARPLYQGRDRGAKAAPDAAAGRAKAGAQRGVMRAHSSVVDATGRSMKAEKRL